MAIHEGLQPWTARVGRDGAGGGPRGAPERGAAQAGTESEWPSHTLLGVSGCLSHNRRRGVKALLLFPARDRATAASKYLRVITSKLGISRQMEI